MSLSLTMIKVVPNVLTELMGPGKHRKLVYLKGKVRSHHKALCVLPNTFLNVYAQLAYHANSREIAAVLGQEEEATSAPLSAQSDRQESRHK